MGALLGVMFLTPRLAQCQNGRTFLGLGWCQLMGRAWMAACAALSPAQAREPLGFTGADPARAVVALVDM